MIVMNSTLLLEQITELESKIQKLENAMNELGIEWDKDRMLELLIARQLKAPAGK